MSDTQTSTHISQVGTVMVPVSDQDQAIAFYTEKLGLELRADTPFGNGDRWVEVAPAGAATTLALVTPRNRLLDALLPRPFLRKVILRLPQFLQPAPKRYAFVLGLDQNGRVIQNLQDPSGKAFAVISSVLEHDGKLYFGSIGEESVGRISVPAR